MHFVNRKRHRLYKLMLENMSDDQRFQLTAKLCSEVLAPVVDGLVTFDPEAAAVLQDTLVVLASKVNLQGGQGLCGVFSESN